MVPMAAEELLRDTTANLFSIDLDAVGSNIAALQQHLAPRTRIMAIIKANAYGTEMASMAQFLTRCAIDIFGVAFVDEGVALRAAGVEGAIFALSAYAHEAPRQTGPRHRHTHHADGRSGCLESWQWRLCADCDLAQRG